MSKPIAIRISPDTMRRLRIKSAELGLHQGEVIALALGAMDYAQEARDILDDVRDDVATCADYEASHESHRPDRAIDTMRRLERIDAFLGNVPIYKES